jgi:cytochrome b561
VGVTVFGVTIARLLWRLTHPAPPLALPLAERIVANLVYVGIYAVLLIQPIIGWITSSAFGFPVVYLGFLPLPLIVAEDRAVAERFQQIHFNLAMVLVALFAAHLGGVLYHHLVLQDGVLRRMLPGTPAFATAEDAKDAEKKQ